MIIIKSGSKWIQSGDQFTVISVTALDGKIWVFYRNTQGTEFSCWEETFLQRFTPVNNS
jgi:hypothetical protein